MSRRLFELISGVRTSAIVSTAAGSDRVIRFGIFELDVHASELRKGGVRVPIAGLPLQVLTRLAEKPGQLVTREELRNRLWSADTFVDFDHGLRNAIARLREALGDSADAPRYIETLPRRGYRFIGQVAAPVASAEKQDVPLSATVVRRRLTLLALVALAALAGLGITYVRVWRWSTVHPIRSLAVLPLENLTGNPDQDYFVDGMTDELITSLAKVGSVRVISRTSSMHYKKAQKTVSQIGRELGVDAVVEGTVSRSGDRVRVTVQLIDARRDHHLWAQDYNRQLGDLVRLQNQIASEITAEIRAKLTPRERVQLSEERHTNPAAYDAYLKGRFHWNRWNEDGLKKSIEYFNRAIEEDPGYAVAWAGLSDSYDLLGDFGILPTREVLPKAKEAAQKALALDESLSEAHVSLGGALLHLEWAWPAAETEFQRAIALDPSNGMAHQWYGYYLISMGRFEDALREMKQALNLDPLSANKDGSLGWAFYLTGRYDEALQHYREMAELDSNNWKPHYSLALTYERKRAYRQAVAEWINALKLQRRDTLATQVGQESFSSGHMEAKKLFLRSDLIESEQRVKRGYVSQYNMAADCAELGDRSRALNLLERAFEERDAGLIYLQIDEEFDSIRSDPRFQALLHRMKFP